MASSASSLQPSGSPGWFSDSYVGDHDGRTVSVADAFGQLVSRLRARRDERTAGVEPDLDLHAQLDAWADGDDADDEHDHR